MTQIKKLVILFYKRSGTQKGSGIVGELLLEDPLADVLVASLLAQLA